MCIEIEVGKFVYFLSGCLMWTRDLNSLSLARLHEPDFICFTLVQTAVLAFPPSNRAPSPGVSDQKLNSGKARAGNEANKMLQQKKARPAEIGWEWFEVIDCMHTSRSLDLAAQTLTWGSGLRDYTSCGVTLKVGTRKWEMRNGKWGNGEMGSKLLTFCFCSHQRKVNVHVITHWEIIFSWQLITFCKLILCIRSSLLAAC